MTNIEGNMENMKAFVKGTINITWNNNTRKVTIPGGTLTIIRNHFREIYIECAGGNNKSVPIRLQVKNIQVHNRFMAEGKATIQFKDEEATLLLSNAPPADLGLFLRLLFIKMKNEDAPEPTQATTRAKFLSTKPRSFEEISPATVAETHAARMAMSKGTATTPSPPSSKKRPSDGSLGPKPKKLHVPSPLTSICALNEEQQRVLDACVSGKNVFFTGSAGTGKSFLLRRIIAALPPDVTMPTASTGVAACHIGGTTLHAFAGIGAGDGTIERCYQLASKPVVAQKWRKCRHLVIDEISMIDGSFFDKIEKVARHIRKNDKPFGGIQLILCGDFLQLPPVVARGEQPAKRFCFQSEAWKNCINIAFELQVVHRQKDSKFVSILNSIRIGRVTEEITERLLATAKQKIEIDGILATQLCSHTNDSNLINESKLKQLTSNEKIFHAQDSEPHSASILDSQTVAPSKLVLKEGAQVMLLKNVNIGAGLVNGARGIVIKFEDGLPVVRFKNRKEYVAKTEKWVVKTSSGNLISRRQVPLNLAWAFSIHKSQGLTLDCVEMSLSKIFEAGQAYVALSRASSLESLRVLDFDSKQVWANPTVLEFYQKFRRRLLQAEMIPLGRQVSMKDSRLKTLEKIKNRMKGKLSNKPLVNIS